MLGHRVAGYAFFVPFGENTRYDLVIDDGERLARVQCKTGRLRTGAVRFAVCSSYAHHPNPKLRRDYQGEIDYFAVYCPETDGVYLVPIEDVPTRELGALRVSPPRNGQTAARPTCRGYEIGRVRGAAPGRRHAAGRAPVACTASFAGGIRTLSMTWIVPFEAAMSVFDDARLAVQVDALALDADADERRSGSWPGGA